MASAGQQVACFESAERDVFLNEHPDARRKPEPLWTADSGGGWMFFAVQSAVGPGDRERG